MLDIDGVRRGGVEEVVEIALLCAVGSVFMEQLFHEAVPPRAAPGVVEVVLHGVVGGGRGGEGGIDR